MQWSYDEFGIITFSTELWNPEVAAGLAEPAKYQIRARTPEDELNLLEYNDKHLGGRGFVAWTPFDHPQLGPVEIGGWTHMFTFRNPPPLSWASSDEARQFLFDTIHANCLFTLKHAACAPRLVIERVQAEPLGAGLFKITALVANHGFLPTHLTQRALEHAAVGSVQITITAPEGAEVIMGALTQDVGHLAGRDERQATWSPWMRQWSQTRKEVGWLVRAPSKTTLTITAQSDRAGVQRQEISLP